MYCPKINQQWIVRWEMHFGETSCFLSGCSTPLPRVTLFFSYPTVPFRDIAGQEVYAEDYIVYSKFIFTFFFVEVL